MDEASPQRWSSRCVPFAPTLVDASLPLCFPPTRFARMQSHPYTTCSMQSQLRYQLTSEHCTACVIGRAIHSQRGADWIALEPYPAQTHPICDGQYLLHHIALIPRQAPETSETGEAPCWAMGDQPQRHQGACPNCNGINHTARHLPTEDACTENKASKPHVLIFLQYLTLQEENIPQPSWTAE